MEYTEKKRYGEFCTTAEELVRSLSSEPKLTPDQSREYILSFSRANKKSK